MSGIKRYKGIFLTVAVVVSLVMLSGCMNKQQNIPLELFSEPTVQETIDLEDDSVIKYELTDLEKNHRYPVCSFEHVVNETAIKIIRLKWDAGSPLRIGVEGQSMGQNIKSCLDLSMGSLSNTIIGDFQSLPSGEYTLFLESLDGEGISSVSLYYSIK